MKNKTMKLSLTLFPLAEWPKYITQIALGTQALSTTSGACSLGSMTMAGQGGLALLDFAHTTSPTSNSSGKHGSSLFLGSITLSIRCGSSLSASKELAWLRTIFNLELLGTRTMSPLGEFSSLSEKSISEMDFELDFSLLCPSIRTESLKREGIALARDLELLPTTSTWTPAPDTRVAGANWAASGLILFLYGSSPPLGPSPEEEAGPSALQRFNLVICVRKSRFISIMVHRKP